MLASDMQVIAQLYTAMCSAVVWYSATPSAWLPSSPCSCLWQHQQQLQHLSQPLPAGWPECCLCLQIEESLSDMNNDTTAGPALPSKVHGLASALQLLVHYIIPCRCLQCGLLRHAEQSNLQDCYMNTWLNA